MGTQPEVKPNYSFELACALLREEGATIEALQERCGISRRTAYRYLQQIRDSGARVLREGTPGGAIFRVRDPKAPV